MTTIKRSAEAAWGGAVPQGSGKINTPSSVLTHTAYSFGTRFQHERGTNPEELLAAAHAACYSMTLAYVLSQQGFTPKSITTRAICTIAQQPTGGYKLAHVRLETTGEGAGIDPVTFKVIAQGADELCVISNALRGTTPIEVDAQLI